MVRVVPDVSGLDKTFWYRLPEALTDDVEIGDVVRVPLHGRSVRGWIAERRAEPPGVVVDGVVVDELKPVSKRTGYGPSADLVELSEWASWRWAGRRRVFLGAATPPVALLRRPRPRPTGLRPEPRSPATTDLLDRLRRDRLTAAMVRLPPSDDVLPAILSAVALGPCLVVVPRVRDMRLMAARLRRTGLAVAAVPEEWAEAAGGVDVVIGTRTAAWAPCPGLAAAVVVDEHDEALGSESSPTWHARDVLLERCRRLGVPLVMVSPIPSIASRVVCEVVHPPANREAAGWPTVEIVDRNDAPPWQTSLVSSRLIEDLRVPGRRVLCIVNATGRARLSACRSCQALARCENCGAAVVTDDAGRLVCQVCSTIRPPACTACAGNSFATLRPGVTRLREELEAAAARPVARLTADDSPTPGVDIHVGTEAALHRIDAADVVAFLDIDRELLAPRLGATEQALTLVVRAGRLVGGRRAGGGRVLLQTRIPDHPVVRAVVEGRPEIALADDADRRRALGLPPWGAIAEIGGAGSEAFIASLDTSGIDLADLGGRWLLRAGSIERLCDVLAAGRRPAGSRLRIAVDPLRV